MPTCHAHNIHTLRIHTEGVLQVYHCVHRFRPCDWEGFLVAWQNPVHIWVYVFNTHGFLWELFAGTPKHMHSIYCLVCACMHGSAVQGKCPVGSSKQEGEGTHIRTEGITVAEEAGAPGEATLNGHLCTVQADFSSCRMSHCSPVQPSHCCLCCNHVTTWSVND